jgi:glycosyltransferase involved in cell wall biosynthesis
MFTIIIPTYGRPDNLQRAINSVLNQTYKNFDLIVVDDNDSESENYKLTEAVISNFIDSDIKFLRHGKNHNGSTARNTGLNACNSDFVIFLDDDDELLPNFLSEIERFILEKKALFIYVLAEWKIKNRSVGVSSFKESGNILVDVLAVNTDMNTSCLCIDTQLIKSLGGFNESLKRHQDIEMIARVNEKQDIDVLPSVLVCRHLDSEINQPLFSIFRDNKINFFKILSPILDKLSLEQKKIIYRAHAFQLWAYALKSFEFFYVIRHLGVIFKSRTLYRKFYRKTIRFIKKRLARWL